MRNLLAVWPSLFAVSAGLMAFLPTLPIYVQERFGLDDEAAIRRWSGAAYAAAPLVAAFAGPVWGALADRFGRRVMALRAIAGVALVTALMPFATRPIELVVLRALQGLLAGYIAPAMALATAGVPDGRQGRALATLQVALALGLLCGPAIGAELATFDGIGRRGVFFFTSVLAVVGGLPVLLFAREDRASLQPRGEDRPGLLGGLLRTYRDAGGRVLLALLAAMFLVRFGQHMIEAHVAFWVRELGPLGWIAASARGPDHALDRTTALAFVVLAIAQIVTTPLWGRLGDRFGPLRCLAILSFGLGGTLVVTGMMRDIESFIVLRTIAAVFMAGGMTLAYAAVAKRVASTARSVAFAGVQSALQLGLSAGPLVGGFVSGAFGLDVLFGLGGGCVLAAGVWMLVLRRLSLANASCAS